MGLVIAYLLNPLLNFFEQTIFKKIQPQLKYSKVRRAVSVTTTFVVVILLLTGFFWLLIPQLVESISSLIDRVPGYLNSAKSFLETFLKDNQAITDWFKVDLSQIFSNLETMLKEYLPMVNDILDGATRSVMGVFTTLMNLFVGFVVAIYLL